MHGTVCTSHNKQKTKAVVILSPLTSRESVCNLWIQLTTAVEGDIYKGCMPITIYIQN